MKSEKEENDGHFAKDHVYEGNKNEPYIRAISNALVGLAFTGAGIYQFVRIQKWEVAGGIIEMNDLQQLLYKRTGKWGTLAFLLLLAGIFFYRAYVRWKRIRSYEHL